MGVATSKFECGCYFNRDMDSEKIIHISFCQKHLVNFTTINPDDLVNKMIKMQDKKRKKI